MTNADFLTLFYVCAGILALLLTGGIILLIIGIKTTDNKMGNHNMKDTEGLDNGRVWLYHPGLKKRK